MFNFKSTLLSRYFVVMVLPAIILFVPQAEAQHPSSPPTDQAEDTHHEHYHESALRRFEIITLSSLPFTAVHSYLGVRAVRMIQENKIAPVLTPKNYRVMGISAVSLSLFIGIWDWLHTRNVDRSAPSIPEREQPAPPTDEGIPPEGPIAFSPTNVQHANINNSSTFFGQSQQWLKNRQLNGWKTEPTEGLVIPLFQIRF